MSETPRTPDEWARFLKQNWEKRSRSQSRDFYVASHPGWNEKERWEEQARIDLKTVLRGFDPASLRTWHVLEIGCGVGRIARPLAPQVSSYTGVDIAEGMVEEARVRSADLGNARFFVSDGVAVPEGAQDRRYDLAIATAVFIHCPRDVIGGIVANVYALLAPGGQLRFQLRADYTDWTGLEATAEEIAAAHEQMKNVEEVVVTPEQLSLIEDHYYMGDMFRYDEVAPFLLAQTGGQGKVSLNRWDLVNIYGWIEKT